MRNSQFITEFVDILSLSHEQVLKHFSEFSLPFGHQSGEDSLHRSISCKSCVVQVKAFVFGFMQR